MELIDQAEREAEHEQSAQFALEALEEHVAYVLLDLYPDYPRDNIDGTRTPVIDNRRKLMALALISSLAASIEEPELVEIADDRIADIAEQEEEENGTDTDE